MMCTEHYFYGLAAMTYVTTCWAFAAVRWFHTCRAPKEQRAYIWPDRKLQVLIYLFATLLLPYVIDPTSDAAWQFYKSYFPGTYYFYGGVLLFCFFGSVKQWNQWKTASWVAAILTLTAMLPLALNAWVPGGLLTATGTSMWDSVVTVVSVAMMGYCGVSMWQVWLWLRESRDENYSNPDDFPVNYARRVWLMPLILSAFVWPGYLLDSPVVVAAMSIVQAVFNIVLLITVLPVWRRRTILSVDVDEELETEQHDRFAEERSDKIAAEIEQYVKTEEGFLDAHLRLENVVDHCSYSRSYVSKVFQERFGGFSDYVNGLRIRHFDSYMAAHPNVTREAAAEASGFTSYRAYCRAKAKLEG